MNPESPAPSAENQGPRRELAPQPLGAQPKARRRLRPWVLICLLILTTAAALAAARPVGGAWFFDIAKAPDGAWVVVNKDDRRPDRDRVHASIRGEGALYREWKIQSFTAFNYGSMSSLPLPVVTPAELRTLGLQALDLGDRANGRLEGTASSSEYAATLKALRTMLTMGENRYVDSWLGWAVETSVYLLTGPAIAGIITCIIIAAARGSQRSALQRRLEKIERRVCPVCGYDLRGGPARPVCPECGCDVGRTEDECRAGLGPELRPAKN